MANMTEEERATYEAMSESEKRKWFAQNVGQNIIGPELVAFNWPFFSWSPRRSQQV
jgi:hypothetical protein